jgi:hypothetical protein
MIRTLIHLLLAVAFVSAVGVGAVVAQTLWEPRSLAVSDRSPVPTAKWEMATAANVAGVTVILEQTKLEEVAKPFGAALGSSGVVPDRLQWVCLVAAGEQSRWIAWFLVTDLDKEGAISGFQLRHLGNEEGVDNRCGRVPDAAPLLIAPSDVRLGMTRADALERLGRPGAIFGEVAEYVHEHSKWASLERLQQVRTANGLIVRFRQGVIDAIEAWKSTGPV